MQWGASKCWFSTGTPWLKVGKTYRDINVEIEKKDRFSPSIKIDSSSKRHANYC